MTRIRQPIVSVLAHVDHGKTTLLDYVRRSRVASGEAGGITQHIGASEVPAKKIQEISGDLLKKFKVDLKIPGLLFIDTPGHAAFDLLRKRGGLLSDIAILVIDINEGIKPQTEESINILKSYKTPFVIAANKIDRIGGWQIQKDAPFAGTFEIQTSGVQEMLDKKIYELIGALYERGINAERYDRVDDFTKTVSIIPTSAMTGEGVPDLIAMLSGLAQRYLGSQLEVKETERGKGIILEVRPVKGLGMTIDAILYDGVMRAGDSIVIGHPEGVVKTKIKALLKTEPMKEIRAEKKFVAVKEVSAASGVKISAPGIDDVIAGVPFISIQGESGFEGAEEEVQKEIEEVQITTDGDGVIVRADALGSLEALVKTLREKNIPIRRAQVGHVTKKEVLSLEEVKDEHRIIFAFNTPILPEAEEAALKAKIPIFSSNIIYRLVEAYEEHVKVVEEKKRTSILGTIQRAAKLRLMPNFVFRQSKPAIGGFEMLGGVLRQGADLMKPDGNPIGTVHALQEKGENIPEAKISMQVAVSIDGPTIGRNLKEGDTLYTFISKNEYHELRRQSALLSDNEINVLDEIRDIMIKKDKLWDVEG